ncbi:MAG: TetR family transcriptional regulator [Rhodospirillales bacterium]
MAKAKRPGKPAKPRATAGGGRESNPGRAALEAAMRLTQSRGWRNVTLAGVAAECGMKLDELYRLYPSRAALLAGFQRLIDGRVLAAGVVEADAGSARDRLFEVMMRRYEALLPYREAITSIAADAPRDPLALLCLAGPMRRSMAWMLEAAGISAGGPPGLLKAKGLALVHGAVMRVWLNDKSPDLARTMAALDRALKRVEPIAEMLFAGRWPGAFGKPSKG